METFAIICGIVLGIGAYRELVRIRVAAEKQAETLEQSGVLLLNISERLLWIHGPETVSKKAA